MQDIHRLPEESELEYKLRIGNKVRLENDLTWYEVADIINSELGYNTTAEAYRKQIGRANAALRLDTSNDISMDEKLYELRKERMKLSDQITQNNALIRRLSREETIIDIAKEAVEKISRVKMLPKYVPALDGDSSKAGILLISDWHYGIEINGPWNYYNIQIAKERIAKLRDEVISRGKGVIDELYVLNLGDMIAGNIHLPIRLNSRKDVISQTIEVSELIAEFLNDLSQYFTIKYSSVVDNHSRIDPNKKDALQLESLTRITDWYLKERLKNTVDFEDCYQFSQDIVVLNILGHNVLGVHGDKDIPTTMINKLSTYTQQHYDLICSAHLHHFSSNESNDTMLISNGSVMGTDQYASDLRLNSKPSQTLIICTEENVCDTIYKIVLD